MPQIIFELTDTEAMVLEHIALDPLDYIENLCHWQANLATDEIVKLEMERMLADPTIEKMPSTREEFVLNSSILSAAERQNQE